MKIKLQLASLITLGILAGFVFTLLFTLSFLFLGLPWQFLVGLTIFFNFIMWLVSPYISDLIYKWFYKIQFYEPEKLMSYPYMKFIKNVCDAHKVKVPKIGIIEDDNPTAFTYGSAAFNARIVLTKGLFKFLNEDELEAVIAHELGHIVNNDFIIMTIATTLLEVLYEIYVICTRTRSQSTAFNKRGEKKGDGAALLYVIGLASYFFYWIGTYIVLLLSRIREYYADEFSAKKTNPDHLSSALIKIAYGIASVPDTQKTAHLLNNTRAQGIFDFKTANEIGLVYLNSKDNKGLIEKALLFDLVNPWAWFFELNSTHPLIGKRIKRLSKMSSTPAFDFSSINKNVDKRILWGNFFRDFLVQSSTTFITLAFIAGIIIQITMQAGYYIHTIVVFLILLFAFNFIKVFYRFPVSTFKETSVIECMSDIYASPFRGKPVKLQGQAIGRGQAGYIFGEDMIFQDKSGIIYLNYESGLPIFGNFFFAWKKLEALLNKPALASGWFFRGATHHIELKLFESENVKIKSYAKFWMMFGVIFIFLIIGLVLLLLIPTHFGWI